jgi:hypothetical protein
MKQLYLKSINIIIAFIITISTITAQGNPLAVEQKYDTFCLDHSYFLRSIINF